MQPDLTKASSSENFYTQNPQPTGQTYGSGVTENYLPFVFISIAFCIQHTQSTQQTLIYL